MHAQALESLPLEANVLVHVFSALSLHHGSSSLETASAVCRRWHERVAGGAQLDEDPDNLIGELRSGDKPHRFDRPHDALFLPNGDICIADCDNFRLQVVSREGYYMREVPLSGGTSCPTGVADGDNYLYVVEHGAHQVSKLRKSSSSGHRHAVAGSWGGGDGELRHPWGLTVSNKRVYVTDQGNDRVSVFDADKLKWLFSFGSSGSKQGEFSSPRGVCAHEPSNELYVADFRNHRIQVFSLKDADKAKCPSVRIIGGGGRALGSSTAGRFRGPSGGEAPRNAKDETPSATCMSLRSYSSSAFSFTPHLTFPPFLHSLFRTQFASRVRLATKSSLSLRWEASACRFSRSLVCLCSWSQGMGRSPAWRATRSTAARHRSKETARSCSGAFCRRRRASSS